jgi:cytochrome c oxidase accessory protein FixG
MLGFSGSRKWVYPLDIKGRFSSYHRWSSAVLFLFLAVVPWLRLHGDPLVLIDVPARRLYLLSTIFTASDGVLIMLLALLAAFTLFLFTAVFGRLWCGYACPQSVLQINFVLPIEQWLEGPRSTRMQRDKAGWTYDLARRRGAKWAIYLLVAWLLSMSFMGFFVPAEIVWTGQASGTAYAIVAFFTFLWFWDFAWYREQVCNYICPYARFQGALTDDESLVISYDEPRGEPRGKAAKERGGCIDCHKCVTVCPQGIDIRDGFQLECIACGRCVDACESVMPKLGYPTLVRYSTYVEDKGGQRRWIRPRTVVYSALLTGLSLALVIGVGTHAALEVMVDRAPGSLFITDDDGFVRNTYVVHVTDRTTREGSHTYAVAVEGLPPHSEVRTQPVQLGSNEHVSVPVIVRVPRDAATHTLPITVSVRGADLTIERRTTFKGPGAED